MKQAWLAMLRVDLLPKGDYNSGRSSDMVSFVPSIAQSAKSGDIRDLKETIEKIVKIFLT